MKWFPLNPQKVVHFLQRGLASNKVILVCPRLHERLFTSNNSIILHLLKNVLFPLLVLKGIHHYWKYFLIFSWGLSPNESHRSRHLAPSWPPRHTRTPGLAAGADADHRRQAPAWGSPEVAKKGSLRVDGLGFLSLGVHPPFFRETN